MIDLREHFGIWKRCGNSRFFLKNPGNPWSRLFLNPLDGVLVSARNKSMLDQDPKYTFVVRNASKAPTGAAEAAMKANQPWVEKVVRQFFYLQALGWAADALKKHAGRPQDPGDRDMNNFLAFYQPGGDKYEREGGLPSGERPMLEETLEGVLRTIANMDRSTVDYGDNLSAEDLDEALSERGIIEC